MRCAKRAEEVGLVQDADDQQRHGRGNQVALQAHEYANARCLRKVRSFWLRGGVQCSAVPYETLSTTSLRSLKT